MIVDLHAHYPMQLRESSETSPPSVPPDLGDALREGVLRIACQMFNGRTPVVTIPNLRAGGVGVALSVLYLPFNEMDLSVPYSAPPRADYFEDLLALIEAVERSIAREPDAMIAHNPEEMEKGIKAGKVVLIHAVEGGFHLGESPEAIRANVRALRERGVAYITVAHLFFRGIATNAPALPFLKDGQYNTLFHQPAAALHPLGEALIRAMVAEHILIDVTHMSRAAIDATLALLDSMPEAANTPIVATHVACSFHGGHPHYNITDEHIDAVAQRDGVIGLIACRHWMCDGTPEPTTFDESMDVFEQHVHQILNQTLSLKHVAIGSDMDGFIRPPLPGFESPRNFRAVERRLQQTYPDDWQDITSENALRVLRGYWKGKA